MPLPLLLVGSGLAIASILRARQKKLSSANEKNNTKKRSAVEQHQHDMRLRKKETQHSLKVSLLATGITGAAKLLYAPLLVVAVPLVVYSSGSIFYDALESWRKNRQLRASAVDILAVITLLLNRYYFSTSFVISIYFAGQHFLLKTEDSSNQELLSLFNNHPRKVWLLRDNVEVEVFFEQVKIGEIIVIHAGETVSFDGKVVKGAATIDQHMLTGESQPQEKTVGETVFASTLLVGGKLHIEVEKAGTETVAAQIGEILQSTLDFKSTVEARSTKLANRLAIPTLALGGIALGTMGPISATALINCNFSDIARITTPLGVLSHLKLASEKSILIKDGRALELLSQVDTVVFDKTGTLTQEEPSVGQIHTAGNFKEETILAFAAAAEHRQTHPVAHAIREAAKQRNLLIADVEEVRYELGYGIKARIQNKDILLGSERFMTMENIEIPKTIKTKQAALHEQGFSLVYLAINGAFAGAIELQTPLRPEVQGIVKALRKRGLELIIISGDHEQPTRRLAASLGIDNYYSETLPENKAKHIEALQASGRKVCFIGDGINDTVAMKKAQIAISLSGATTAATDTASIILLDKSLRQLDELFKFSKSFENNMKSGLAWVLLPGVVGAGGVFLFHMGIYGAVALFTLSLGAGTINAALPLLRKQKTITSSKVTTETRHEH